MKGKGLLKPWLSYQDVWRVTMELYNQMVNSQAWNFRGSHLFPNFNAFTTRVRSPNRLIPGHKVLGFLLQACLTRHVVQREPFAP